MDKTLHTLNHFGDDGHPREDVLFLHVEGELSAAEAERLGSHLDACWSCRARAEKMREAIFAYVGYRDRVIVPTAAPPAGTRHRFDAKLERLAAACDDRPLLARALEKLKVFAASANLPDVPPRAVGVAAALAFACLLVLLALRFGRGVPTVSAAELLRNATDAQSERLGAAPEPVVHQELRVRRRGGGRGAGEETLALALWRDVSGARERLAIGEGHARHFVRAKSLANGEAAPNAPSAPADASRALLSDLESVYRRNQLDFRQPLSPAAYEAWRKARGRKTEEVTRSRPAGGGPDVLTLRTVIAAEAVGDGAIVEAALAVRAKDWHPIELRLVTRAGDGSARHYDLTETFYEVLPLGQVRAAVFDDETTPPAANVEPAAPPLLVPRTPPAAVAEEAAAPTIAPGPDAAELDAAEIGARYALHLALADLGEPIDVTRRGGSIEVRGLVETESRKKELLNALRDVPHVVAKIQTVGEAEKAAATDRPGLNEQLPEQPPDEQSDESTRAGNSFRDNLARYFGDRAGDDRAAVGSAPGGGSADLKIVKMSNEAVAHSQAVMAEAWALRRLAERYPPEKIGELREAERRQLEAMVRAHAERLEKRVRGARDLLGPPLLAITSGGNISAGGGGDGDRVAGDWSAAALSAFTTAQRLNRLTQLLFAAAEPTNGAQAEKAARDLLKAVADLDGNVSRLKAAVAH